MTMDLPTALKTLANYRAHNSRASQKVFDSGVVVLKSKNAGNLGEDGWSFLEQLALASIDVGRLDVADRCLQLLSEKFPGSPRVECLTGIRMEATSPPEVAMKYYTELLQANPAIGAIWKRQISLLRRMGKIDQAVQELSRYLDTFYQDVEGWLELADIYSSCNQYTHALLSVSHALLLNPQNPFYFLQAAELACTSGDVPLALKTFLIVVDMSDSNNPTAKPTGITLRAWCGIKQCTRQCLSNPRVAATSSSETPPPTASHLKLLDELATERVLASYSTVGVSKDSVKGRAEVEAWLRG